MEQFSALGYAKQIACHMWREHYQQDAPDWQPLNDLMGVLSQIDNMLTGLTRKPPHSIPKEPASVTISGIDLPEKPPGVHF